MTMAIIPAQTGRISGIFWRRPALGLFLLLLGPLMWFGIVYLGSLLTLLWQSIYTFDDFTMSVTSDFTLANLRALFNPANYDIIVRTTGDGAVRHSGQRAAGTADGLVYGALHQRQNEGLLLYRGHATNVGQLYRQSLCVGAAAGERWRGAVVPRSSWTGGALNALLSVPAVGGNTLSTSGLGRFLVFVYIWLPFMILPVQAALERIPGSLLQASADLGAAPRQTFRYVVLPLAIPGIAAGSIFTFSLTLGDFIVPQLVGPPGYFIGNMVYSQQGAIGNMPMAAAFTLVPIVLIALYLAFVKRLGAFDAL